MHKNNIIAIEKPYSTIKYIIQKTNEQHLVQLVRNNSILLQFTDILGVNHNSFTRVLGLGKKRTSIYIYENGILTFFQKEKSYPTIDCLQKNKKMYNKYITIDLETRQIDNNITPYCISLYDGVKAYSFYLTDFNDVHQLINKVLKTIFTKKYAGKHIYIHNSSEFDMIFLYSYIINYFGNTVKPIIKDGKFINLEVEYGNATRYKVYFKDSLLLLPYSLDKLSKTFNEKHIKDMFPHDFVNKDNLNCVGIVPDI